MQINEGKMDLKGATYKHIRVVLFSVTLFCYNQTLPVVVVVVTGFIFSVCTSGLCEAPGSVRL